MCRIYGVNVPFIFMGEESYIINFISAPTFKNIEIKNIDKEIYLCGYCIYENPDDPEGCYYKVFNNERIIDDFNWHRKIDVYTKTNTGRFAIGHRLGNKYFCEIYWNGSTDSIGLEHFYLGTKNSYLTTKEDTYALFANKNIDGKPLIWKNGEKSYYPINGFLSGVFQN